MTHRARRLPLPPHLPGPSRRSGARRPPIAATVATAAAVLLVALALPAPRASAQVVFDTFTESFVGGSNQGGWQWYLAENQFIAGSGGNPGPYLTASQWTAPGVSIRSSQPGSPFTGDLRAAGVVSFGVDFRSFVLQEDIGNPAFDAYRFTIVVGNDNGTQGVLGDDTAYWFKTDEFLPLVGEGWRSYDVSVPAEADVTPPGWKLVEFSLQGPPANPLRWEQVMADVDYVWLSYNEMDGFYIFANWLLGADNVRVTTASGSAFTDLGQGLSGTHGTPSLTGEGTLLPHTPLALTLGGALENTTAFLFVGFAELGAPFKGGTLVPDPSPPALLVPVPTGPAGAFALAGSWPPGVPSGFELYAQAWVVDGAGPAGFAASNAVRGTAP
jgi:hypothetical protein